MLQELLAKILREFVKNIKLKLPVFKVVHLFQLSKNQISNNLMLGNISHKTKATKIKIAIIFLLFL